MLNTAKQFVQHPIDSAVNMAKSAVQGFAQGPDNPANQMASDEFAKGNIVKGVYRSLQGSIPYGLGSQEAQAEEDLSKGDVGKVAGRAGALASNIEGPRIAGKVAGPLMQKVGLNQYRKALGAPKNIDPESLAEGVKSGITADQSGLTKLKGEVAEESLGQDAAMAQSPNANQRVSMDLAKKQAIDKGEFYDQGRTDFAGSEAADEQVGNLDKKFPSGDAAPQDAMKIKRGMHGQISDAQFGGESTPKVEVLKSVRNGIKQRIYDLFPELQGSAERQGNLLDIEPYVERQAARTGSSPNWTGRAIGAATGGAAGAVAHSAATGGVTGLVAMGAHSLITDPAFRSRLAIAIAKGGMSGVPDAMARIDAAATAIKNESRQGEQYRYGKHKDGKRVRQLSDGSAAPEYYQDDQQQ
jgi:hypothetical protein